jgi:hypothetical protein
VAVGEGTGARRCSSRRRAMSSEGIWRLLIAQSFCASTKHRKSKPSTGPSRSFRCDPACPSAIVTTTDAMVRGRCLPCWISQAERSSEPAIAGIVTKSFVPDGALADPRSGPRRTDRSRPARGRPFHVSRGDGGSERTDGRRSPRPAVAGNGAGGVQVVRDRSDRLPSARRRCMYASAGYSRSLTVSEREPPLAARAPYGACP